MLQLEKQITLLQFFDYGISKILQKILSEYTLDIISRASCKEDAEVLEFILSVGIKEFQELCESTKVFAGEEVLEEIQKTEQYQRYEKVTGDLLKEISAIKENFK